MAKGLALARAIGLKWPAAANDPETHVETTVQEAPAAEIVDVEPVHRPVDDASPVMADALSQALLDTTARGTDQAIGELRESVTNDAITAIEADIASLLASMKSADAPDAAEANPPVDAEDATLALLGELDRLWQADPMVGRADAA
jgi:hypothetical protein